MYRRCSKQIVQSPHPFSQTRLREDPTATKPAQSISLRQTAGNDKLRTEMKRRRWCIFKKHLQIDFVHEDMRTDGPRNFAQLPQRSRINRNSARIMKIGEDYQA